MANFIPREKGYVVRDKNHKVIGIICTWNKLLFPFFLDSEGKAVRADWNKKNQPYVPSNQEYGKMVCQVEGVLSANKQKPNDIENKSRKKIILATKFNDMEKERLSLLSRFKISILDEGYLRIDRNFNYKGTKKKIPDTFPDIDKAIRSRDHLLEKYLDGKIGEIYTNSEITEIINDINSVLLRWTEARICEKIALDCNLNLLLDLLSRSRNDFKISTLDQLAKIPGVKDVLGRINPSAMAARSAKAGSNMEKRGDQIGGIIPFAIAQKAALEREKLEIKSHVLSAKVILKALLNSTAVWHNHVKVNQQLDRVLVSLRSAWVNPYWSPVQDASLIITEAKRNIVNNINLANADIAIALAILG